MAIGDILKLTLTQTYGSGGEKMLNDFFYRVDDPSGTAQACAVSFQGAVLELINDIQDATARNVGIRVINLFDLEDFYEIVITGTGGTQGDGSNTLPIFACVNYTLKLNTRAVRSGSKRFSAISETFQDNGLFEDATWIAAAEALRVQLASNLSGGVTEDALVPVVVKRILVPADEEEGTKEHYRLPETTEELVSGVITAALVKMKVSHQTSRGNGR